MVRGKSKFNSTFAVLEQPAEKDYWNLVSSGHNTTQEAEAAVKAMLLITPNITSRILIVNVKKGFKPRVTVLLNEEGGADALGCKPSNDEEEVDAEEPADGTRVPPACVPVFVAIPAPLPPVHVEPKYQEPTGSDPIQLPSVQPTPTSGNSGIPTVATGQPILKSGVVPLNPLHENPKQW